MAARNSGSSSKVRAASASAVSPEVQSTELVEPGWSSSREISFEDRVDELFVVGGFPKGFHDLQFGV